MDQELPNVCIKPFSATEAQRFWMHKTHPHQNK